MVSYCYVEGQAIIALAYGSTLRIGSQKQELFPASELRVVTKEEQKMTTAGLEPAISWSHWFVVRRDAISPRGHID